MNPKLTENILPLLNKIEKDSFPQVAKLFQADAETETVHTYAHLKAVGGIKSTAENLQVACCKW